MACCGAVCGVRGGREARGGGKHLGAIGGRAVTQERGHVGVVLETGQDYVKLHPLWQRHAHFSKAADRSGNNTTISQKKTLDIKLVDTLGSYSTTTPGQSPDVYQ